MRDPLRGRLADALAPYRRWWVAASSPERAIGAVAFLVVGFLAGAFLFGVWHVIVGGAIRGNWRAGGFGVVLAAVTGALLVAGHHRWSGRFRR